MKWYPYGHDFGNAEMSGAVPGKGGLYYTRNIPTAFTKTNKNAMKGLGVEVDRQSTFVFSFDSEESTYAIGELALSQSRDPWNGRGDIERYASQHALRGMLTVASTLLTDKEARPVRCWRITRRDLHKEYGTTGADQDRFRRYL